MSRPIIDVLRSHSPLILPSMLMCDFGNLEREVKLLEEAGIEALHLDVMDGQFVPNFTYGMTLVSAFRKITDLPLDVHLMIQNPVRYIDDFANAGADIITFHAEATDDSKKVIERIHANGLPAGIAINAKTPVQKIENVVASCELALLMSIEAGFGGQPFDDCVLPKFVEIREIAGDSLLLEIDGGINAQTIAKSIEHGAQLLVVGSAIFKKNNYAEAIQDLTKELARVSPPS